MIAYFGLLSSVSLIFLALALLGYTGRAEESSYLVRELQKLFPSQSITDIVKVVDAITSNATTLGLIGAGFLLWTSLSLFSVLESAFNIVYARPNRPFLRGKFLATLFMAGSLIILSAALVLGSFGYDLMQRFAPDFIDNATFRIDSRLRPGTRISTAMPSICRLCWATPSLWFRSMAFVCGERYPEMIWNGSAVSSFVRTWHSRSSSRRSIS